MADQKLIELIKKQDRLLRDLPKLIRQIMREELDKSVQKQLKGQLGKLPTKDEFYQMMDELMGELKAIREKQTLITHRSANHEDRLEKLEAIHPSYQHA